MDSKRQSGFSLVEILVGLVIGLLAMLAIFQTLALFESQRRTTGSGADMQQNGLSALYTLEQDIRLGGYGLIDNGSIPCFNVNAYGSPQSIFQSIPVRILDGGTGPDSLITARLDSDTGGVSTGGGRAQLTAAVSSLPGSIALDTNVGIHNNDFVMIAQSQSSPPLDCSLFRVTGLSGTTSINVQAVSNAAGSAGTPVFPSYNGNSTVPYATIVDIGQSAPFVTSTYSVSGGTLVQSDNGAASVPLTANIVNVQAQYGIAPAGSQSINCWTDATSSGASCASGDWTQAGLATNPANAARIKAIRIAIVAKSALKEKPKSGTACDATASAPTSWPSAGLPSGSSNPPTIDLTSDSTWQCYRYKVYSTIVPLRNVIWGNL